MPVVLALDRTDAAIVGGILWLAGHPGLLVLAVVVLLGWYRLRTRGQLW